MSSGQAAWAQEKREEALDKHIKQLEQLGFAKIAQISAELEQAVCAFDRSCPPLSRDCFKQLGNIKNLTRELNRRS